MIDTDRSIEKLELYIEALERALYEARSNRFAWCCFALCAGIILGIVIG